MPDFPPVPPLDGLDPLAPPSRWLSNGRYVVLLNANGGGVSRGDGVTLTRWDGDPVEDRGGFRMWVAEPGERARTEVLPSGTADDVRHPGRVRWSPGLFTCEREWRGIELELDACVAPETPAELRRLTLHNRTDRPRPLEVTTCAEVVLGDADAHAAHPGFSRLFLQTGYAASHEALFVSRRPRAAGERHPVLVNALDGAGALEHETDRVRFVGRGRDMDRPLALERGAPLTGTTGNVLDPVVALRRRFTLAPHARTELVALLGLGDDRDAALEQIARLGRRVADAFDRATAHERGLLAALGLTDAGAEYLNALAGAIAYGHPAARGTPAPLSLSARRLELGALAPPRGGWLVVAHGAIAAEARRAQRYWKALGLPVRLVLLEAEGPESEDVHVVRGASADWRARLEAAADLVLAGGWPGLASPPGPVVERVHLSGAAMPAAGLPAPDGEALTHFNGLGGFSPDGREYVIRLEGGPEGLALPPQPWVNVIANERFGLVVSETGSASTWSGNSREHRLTPWSNDALLDPHGEALWLRDDEARRYWSLTPGPTPHPGGYEVRHGFGASTFLGRDGELSFETTWFVPDGGTLRVAEVRLVNRGTRPRRLTLFSCQRLVLGASPVRDGRHVVTAYDRDADALLATSPLAGAWADATAFAAAIVTGAEARIRFTCDRRELIGRPGRMAAPRAIASGTPLSGRFGAGLDPCFAHEVAIELPPGAGAVVAFALGETAGVPEASAALARLREPGAVAALLATTRARWRETLERVRIETPEPAIDLMVNGWLAYQNLSCRMWGRTAFYQSGGAFGFRDQLQDAVAMVWLRPELTRAQILLHAAHQFAEGDVLHWWHPPASRGIRTRFADDLLWLPWAVAEYVGATGDDSILCERAPFLTARALEPGEDEAYLEPAVAPGDGDVFEHCVRALDRALATGAHGLPRFGTGDWNDGMNRVGREGRGESVWMAFFLHHVMGGFLPLLAARGDELRLARYEQHRARLVEAANAAGWDGGWYRRGYYDDGTPLGTRDADECRIDALAQAWAVISGVAPPARAHEAMDALERELVSERDRLVRLLAPPFEHTPHDPGYIKGYVPGVRENGGQYTHAALWAVRALAELGRSERAARLLAMLSPVSHARTAADVERYRVEPYVVAADVYGAEPHVGRGGWTWYTGSAGWMFRVALESVLGLSLEGGRFLALRPCLPAAWRTCRVTWRMPGAGTRYDIELRQRERDVPAPPTLRVDGALVPVEGAIARVPLARDGAVHRVELEWTPVAGPLTSPAAPGG